MPLTETSLTETSLTETSLNEPSLGDHPSTPPNPPTRTDPPIAGSPPPRRLHLTATQLLASALAAITATVAASYLGVAGTVVGAAVASVVSVAGNAIYSASIQRTGHRVRAAVPVAGRLAAWSTASAPATPDTATTDPPGRHRGRIWPVIGAACVGVFAGVLLLVTLTEVIAGRPLTDLVRDRSGAGTTVFGTGLDQASDRRPTPTVTVTVVPKVVTTTPTVTATAPAVTRTVSPPASSPVAPPPASRTPTPTPSPTPSEGSSTAAG